jgi:hypothetical protein
MLKACIPKVAVDSLCRFPSTCTQPTGMLQLLPLRGHCLPLLPFIRRRVHPNDAYSYRTSALQTKQPYTRNLTTVSTTSIHLSLHSVSRIMSTTYA